MLLEASSLFSFLLLLLPRGQARTRTKAVARVDACKWDGRGRRQNCGKLKLMNNRPPRPPVCSPPPAPPTQRGDPVENRRGTKGSAAGVRWKRRYNDDTQRYNGIKARWCSARVISSPPSSSFSSSFGDFGHLFRVVLLQATNAFLTSSPPWDFPS